MYGIATHKNFICSWDGVVRLIEGRLQKDPA